jgi:hypothetical protein
MGCFRAGLPPGYQAGSYCRKLAEATRKVMKLKNLRYFYRKSDERSKPKMEYRTLIR